MSYSIRLEGDTQIDLRVKPWSKPALRRNVTWEQDSSGRWLPSDRGSQADWYDAELTVFGVKSAMETFGTWLEAEGKGSFNVTIPSGVHFAPNVNQTLTMEATILDLERLKQVFWASPTSGVDEVSLTLRLISPSLYGTAGSLSSLRLQEQYEQDSSWAVSHSYLESGDFVSHDRRDRAGRFSPSFDQSTAEMIPILNFLVGDGRAEPFTLPTLPGVTYPFGIAQGSGPFECRAVDFSFSRKSLDRWNLEIEFAQDFE